MNITANTQLTVEEIKARLERFHTRVDQAFEKSAPTKSWVRDALARRGASRCPKRLRRLSNDVIVRYGDALADLFREYPDDIAFTAPYDLFVGYQPPEQIDRVDPIWAMSHDAQWMDEWGTRWHHSAGGVGASTITYPLTEWDSLEDYIAHRIPDPFAPGRLNASIPTVQKFGKTKCVFGMAQLMLYERFHCLRSMENAFTDFYLYPKESQRLLEALTDYFLEYIRNWGRLEGLDGLLVTDDWGTQQSLMISPDMWRKFFADPYRRLFDEMHRLGLYVLFHSCGNVTEIIGDLIDLGVDIIDPLQPEAVDLKEIARNFGGKVTFCGGLSDQKIARSTPREVRDDVRRTIDTLGRDFKNAYIIAPSNVMTPEIPLENIEAVFRACHNL